MLDLMDTPRVVIDLDIVEQNCRTMAESLARYHIAWRPHIKTHKSVLLAKKQQECGAKGITCAKIGEAEIMANAGFDDIYLAYPLIGQAKLTRYLALSRQGKRLRTLVNDLSAAEALGAAFAAEGREAQVLLEVDGRFGRGGVPLARFEAFARAAARIKGIQVVGAASFCGNSSHMANEADRRADAKIEAGDLLKAREILLACGLEASVLSSGSSVSSRYPECLAGITESRAGTCIFNDMTHVSLGTVPVSACAATVAATVVTLPEKGKAIIDAGSKTLSSDLCDRPGYGYVVEYPGIEIPRLSEEHGFLDLPDGLELQVGEVLHIIPNHICPVVNLTDSAICIQSGREPFVLPIDARGKNR